MELDDVKHPTRVNVSFLNDQTSPRLQTPETDCGVFRTRQEQSPIVSFSQGCPQILCPCSIAQHQVSCPEVSGAHPSSRLLRSSPRNLRPRENNLRKIQHQWHYVNDRCFLLVLSKFDLVTDVSAQFRNIYQHCVEKDERQVILRATLLLSFRRAPFPLYQYLSWNRRKFYK